jgi:hypothetical protein
MFMALAVVSAPIAAVAHGQAAGDANTRTLAEAEAGSDTAAQPDSLAESNKPPEKVRSVTLVGDKPCPKSTGDEIVVCSRLGEGDQFRIPSQFRKLPNPAANNSWVNRAQVVNDVSREAAGLPDTCSVVGDGGQTGCAMKAFRQYQAERRAQQREQEAIP